MSSNDAVLCALVRVATLLGRLPGTMAVFSLLAFVLSITGCGGPKLPTVPVTGVVTYNGSPLEGAEVAFLTKEKDAKGAAGRTDSNGKFVLRTHESGANMLDGALPGDYQVTVSKRDNPMQGMHPGQPGFDMNKIQEEAIANAPKDGGPGGGPPGRGGSSRNMQGMMRGAAMGAGKSLIPQKYEDPAQSGLTATVKPSGNQPFSFELKD